nr:hypothetical protein [Vicinamibacterales bacterium]
MDEITTLGPCRFPSPRTNRVSDEERIPELIRQLHGRPAEGGRSFELAGPRERLFFEPGRSCAAIVTCGGLCPGLNNVIRSVFL